ncbi:MAG TPA: PAS domain-containing protein [Bacteroidota bacterium]|nr:PAS domain-containing protein [Bacteroidota bacterium]
MMNDSTSRSSQRREINKALNVDVIERRQAEECLRQSEGRLHDVLDAAGIGMWELDLETDEIVSFGHHDRILGFESGTFDGTLSGFQNCVHPDDFGQLKNVVVSARDKCTEYNHEFRVLWRDGSTHWISAKGRFTYADSGRPMKMRGYLVDITDRKQAERALQQSEAKLREAQRLAGIGYWERDPINDRILWSDGISEIVGLPVQNASFTQTQLQELIHPDDRQRQRDALTEALNARKSYDVEYRLIRPDGNVRFVHVRDEVQYDAMMRPIRLFGTMQDITERKQAEEKIHQYAARMEVLARVSRALAECRQDVQVELDTIAVQTASLIGDGCIIALLAPDGNGFQFGAHHHRDPEVLKTMEEARTHMPILDAESAWVARILKTGEGLLISEIEPEKANQVIDPPFLKYFQSFLAVPLRVEGRVTGICTLFRSEPGQSYTPDDHVLLQDLADRAALITQNARLFKQVEIGRERYEALSRRLMDAQEDERRSLARELHDELGQQLTAIKFALDNLNQQVRDPQNAERISAASSMVDELLQRGRAIALDLRPSLLDEFGLASALRWYVKRQAEVARLEWSVNAEIGRRRYTNDIETACFRIAQEAVTNVLRYAHASHLVAELKEIDEHLHLYVRDDGRGFDVARAKSAATSGKSFGIINMEERASMLGGSLEITSTQAKGTEIHVRLPLHAKTTRDQTEGKSNESH